VFDESDSPKDLPYYQTTVSAGVSYGDYFTTADIFLTKNNHSNLLNTLNQVLEPAVSANGTQTIDLHLIKHDKYYRPAHVFWLR
jgi:hypothetical protein